MSKERLLPRPSFNALHEYADCEGHQVLNAGLPTWAEFGAAEHGSSRETGSHRRCPGGARLRLLQVRPGASISVSGKGDAARFKDDPAKLLVSG